MTRQSTISRTLLVVGVLLCCRALWHASALRCRTDDGPSSEDVQKIVRTCLQRLTGNSENRSSDEYGNYDSSYSEDNDENDSQGEGTKSDGKRGIFGNRKSDQGSDHNHRPERTGGNRRGERRQQESPRQDWGDDSRNRHGYDNVRGGGRMDDNGRRYKRQYYNGGYGQMPSGPQGDGYGNDHRDLLAMDSRTNGSSNSSTTPERDQACMMQCFFQEMKMTNTDGLPDKHKVLHVITKDLRDHELREFYTDAIQQCFHMMSMENKLKEKCAYSMKFITCLVDHSQANCNDWEYQPFLF